VVSFKTPYFVEHLTNPFIKTTIMRNAPKKELMTMEEKMKLDPNEIMENGLTREHNEKIDKDGENFQVWISLITIGVMIWVIVKSMSIVSSL
jgi:hypothetical protein